MRPLLALLMLAGGFALAPSCADPVRDGRIAALGGEEPGVSPGPEHRPGQPCLLCHAPGGPASSHPFAVAGTVYQTKAYDAPPAKGISVQFVDDNNGAPRVVPITNAAGNFFVRQAEWPDLAFPIRVGLYDDPTKAPKQTMLSLIGREGSCGYCHAKNLDPGVEPTPDELEASKQSAGQIYFSEAK